MPLMAVLLRPSNRTGSAYMTKWRFLPDPLGLLALAGEMLRIPGCSFEIMDMSGENLTLDQVMDAILREGFNISVLGEGAETIWDRSGGLHQFLS